MLPVIIRNAVTADLATLLKFEQGVINAERPYDPTLKSGAVKYYDLEAMIAADDVTLVVAELNGEPIASGYARIKAAEPYLVHEKFAYLGFMYVIPEERGKGINKLIIEALKKWVKEKGITEMRLEVYAGNDIAVRAYEKFGFNKHMIEMRMAVT